MFLFSKIQCIHYTICIVTSVCPLINVMYDHQVRRAYCYRYSCSIRMSLLIAPPPPLNLMLFCFMFLLLWLASINDIIMQNDY